MPKPKAYVCQSYIKKFMASLLKNLSCFDQKYEKWKPNEKLSIKCKHFDRESYMFISTSEIGHLTSCKLCMIWLNWLLKLHT